MFQLDVTALIVGLGLGVPLLLYLWDTLQSLRLMTVLADRPFEIGDWIVSDGVEGRLKMWGCETRVRTFTPGHGIAE